MATTADFKNGLCIKHNGNLWKIESFQHVKPGKGPAFVRTKMRNLNTSRILENTFTAGVKINIIRIENRKYQYFTRQLANSPPKKQENRPFQGQYPWQVLGGPRTPLFPSLSLSLVLREGGPAHDR